MLWIQRTKTDLPEWMDMSDGEIRVKLIKQISDEGFNMAMLYTQYVKKEFPMWMNYKGMKY